jgi:serine/threonine protein kinase
MSDSAPVATVVQGHTFTIDKRYEPKKILGRGSFGVVCTAEDHVRGFSIAIKRIRPYANDEWDARHTLREVRLMKVLGPHPNVRLVVSLVTYVIFVNY